MIWLWLALGVTWLVCAVGVCTILGLCNQRDRAYEDLHDAHYAAGEQEQLIRDLRATHETTRNQCSVYKAQRDHLTRVLDKLPGTLAAAKLLRDGRDDAGHDADGHSRSA